MAFWGLGLETLNSWTLPVPTRRSVALLRLVEQCKELVLAVVREPASQHLYYRAVPLTQVDRRLRRGRPHGLR
eukprot:732421-Prymnesium_polylepis.1